MDERRVMTTEQKSEQLTIREMCEAFDVTPRTLRFYEAKELINPIREGTRRLFTRRDRVRLKLILRAKRFGFNLEDIRQMLDLYDRDTTGAAQYVRTFDLARQRLSQMEDQRRDLDDAIAELRKELTAGADLYASYCKQMAVQAA